MPLDPQARNVMDQLEALGLPPNHTVSPQEAREIADCAVNKQAPKPQ